MSINNSSTATPIDFINSSLEATTLKPGPRLLLARIVSWCGKKGRCWYSVETMAQRLNVSHRTIQRWKKALMQANLLAVTNSPYRTSYLIPYPNGQSCGATTDTPGVTNPSPNSEELKEQKRCTVPNHSTHTTTPSPEPKNENAVKVCSPEPIQRVTRPHQPTPRKSKSPITPDHFALVKEIERVTGDTWSRGSFLNLVRQTDENTVYIALSITREKLTLESGVNAGAYFTATVKGMLGTQQVEPKPVEKAPPPQAEDNAPHNPAPNPVPVNEHIESDPFDSKALRKGWKRLYRPGSVGMVLNIIGRYLTDWDVRNSWKALLKEREGEQEDTIFDEFLDLAELKVRYRDGRER